MTTDAEDTSVSDLADDVPGTDSDGADAGSGGGAPPVTGTSPASPELSQRKAPLWTKLAIVLGALLMVSSGVVVFGPRLIGAWLLSGIDVVPVLPPDMRGDSITGPINFLLVGTDERMTGPNSGELSKADTIVLVHIPAAHNQAYLISLPRDLRLQIPDFAPTGYNGRIDKLNTAFAHGAMTRDGQRDMSPQARANGALLTMMTIDQLVACGEWKREPVTAQWDGLRCRQPEAGPGLEWHGWAAVNFEGFDKVVEAVGGVHMCIDEDVWSIHRAADGSPVDFYWAVERGMLVQTRPQRYYYPKGKCYDMQPWEALDYSRQRYDVGADPDENDSDYERHRHQQQLLTAIMSKIASSETLTSVGRINDLKEVAGDLLTLELVGPVEEWAWTLRNLRAEDMVSVATYGGHAHETGGMNVDGQWYEPVLPSLVELLAHVREDTVADFLLAHPDWVSPDPTPPA